MLHCYLPICCILIYRNAALLITESAALLVTGYTSIDIHVIFCEIFAKRNIPLHQTLANITDRCKLLFVRIEGGQLI